MKKLVLLLFLILFALQVKAQQYYPELVYLKNGEILKGIIIERIPWKSIVLKTEKGNQVINYDSILKIKKEILSDVFQLTHSQEKTISVKEFTDDLTVNNEIIRLDFNGILGFADTFRRSDLLQFQVLSGRRISQNVFVGMGIGARYSFYNGHFYGPIIADVRYGISQWKYRGLIPTIALSGGYVFDLTDRFSPFGAVFSPKIGIQKRINSTMIFHLNLGLDYQFADKDMYYNNYQRDMYFHGLNVSLSFEFL